MSEEHCVKERRLLRLGSFTVWSALRPLPGGRCPPAAQDGSFCEMEGNVELRVALTYGVHLVQRPYSIVHVTLDSDRVKEVFVLMVKPRKQVKVSWVDPVIVDEQRRAWISRSSDS